MLHDVLLCINIAQTNIAQTQSGEKSCMTQTKNCAGDTTNQHLKICGKTSYNY